MAPKLLILIVLAAIGFGLNQLIKSNLISLPSFGSGKDSDEQTVADLSRMDLPTFSEVAEVTPGEIVAFTTTPRQVTLLKFYSET